MVVKPRAISQSATCINGMSGMGHKNPGPIGTCWLVVSSREFAVVPGQVIALMDSEFGMQGYPNIRTVKAWQNDGDDTEFFPQSRVSVNHNKAVSQTRAQRTCT